MRFSSRKLDDLIYSKNNSGLLERFAKNNDIEKLSSEDIMKLFEKGYSLSTISNTFKITNNELKKIRDKKGISNMILETRIRNNICILYYLKNKKYYNILNRKKVLKDVFNMPPINANDSQAASIVKKLNSIDWFSLDLNKEIKKEILI